ncbi:UDP-N-acetylmuramoyl-tripeptide--D-alanyl-D-alanine ligase [Metabacillus litoralis]|uniref:UDP-N-acetylmuramoyl-tripeptide--D-alanyl-D-alanine ligase n=1 Tax=Metabacillus litoralis TaxID=152268 RepID=A0A5C6WA81_9BACI|nr:UDP-N-acetylmuramoyl-tripeptide--D-alanyl-D-alanine ligase [Metabacillus litoralis]TXC92789.1 UDP-N-acetylmuramoyl-tripeptide--D-alanyl-D-alanine ligase [Metabacillus litoralis]
MKPLLLKDIVREIDGSLVKGYEESTIQKVVKRQSNIDQHVLYFCLAPYACNWDLLKTKQGYSIVVDHLTGEEPIHKDVNIILVNDCKEAYWKFICYYRSLFDIPVIGVTGTCGKTTTKDMINHIAKEDLMVHKTFQSQNGLHLNHGYLFGLDDSTQLAVFEMGVAYRGNVRSSGRYFRPTVGVITNIGEAHLEGCRTLENYIKAKAEMLEALSYKGMLIINADDENIKKIDMSNYQGKIISFGVNEEANYRANKISYANEGMNYTLLNSGKQYTVFIPGYGEHNIFNSLAAIAACHSIGISIETCINRLQTFRTMSRHVKIYEGYNQSMVIDDTWSCNPSSVKAAMQVLKNISKDKKEIFVLGKMQRLGKHLQEQHIKIGKTFMEMGGLDYLITVGSHAKLTGMSAIENGMAASKVIMVDSASELDSVLEKLSGENSCILFKMSLGKMKSEYRQVVVKYRQA